MRYHWGDFVHEAITRCGLIAIGIDPVRSAVPRCFFRQVQDQDDLSWLICYVEFLLETAKDHVAIVKFQSAYFESLGSRGIAALATCIAVAKRFGFGVILDAKRGDIGSTAEAYARAYLTPKNHGGSDLEVDCITVNPYLGLETLNPYLDCASRFGKGIFVLAKTSNPGSAWLQDRKVDGNRVSEMVASGLREFSQGTIGPSGLSNTGIVVGATYPEDGMRLREILPNSVFLAPGVGVQGASVSSVRNLLTPTGSGVIVPVSRGITSVSDLSICAKSYEALIVERLRSLKDSIQV